MDISVGYEIIYDCLQPTPMVLMLNIHHTRIAEMHAPDLILTDPVVPLHGYHDTFGNWCTRLVTPVGRFRITGGTIVRDSGAADRVRLSAPQAPIEQLPDDTLIFLLGSRYCETDRLSDIAWALFGHVAPGWARVEAIVDYVHDHIAFSYAHARPTRTAWETLNEQRGVCRDFAHLAITFCRCLNIPARYCSGYLGDIGVPPLPDPMDFSAWLEAFLDGEWYTFDARHRIPRIGRIVIGYGRDAADVPISTSFGPNELVSFRVWTTEVPESRQAE